MLEDVYPLSPLQEGLYYHWLNAPDSPVYFAQLSSRVKGDLNLRLLEESYCKLVSRHAILRTSFTHDFGEKPLQVVKKNTEPVFVIMSSPDTMTAVEEHKKADRERGFDLSKGSQMRLTVLDLGNKNYEFIWSHHHILMDGWCVRILIKEFFQIYLGLVHGKDPGLKKVYPFSDYIGWLEKVDKAGSLQYWRNYLSGYSEISSIPGLVFRKNRNSSTVQKKVFSAEGQIRQSIKHLCSELNITENTFVQAVWGVLLGKYNNTEDVVFGAVVSGRPPELEGVEDMIGLFINTIPARAHVKEEKTFTELLKEIQQTSIEGISHHSIQLAEIQAESKPGRELFDHILIFENYPDQEPIEKSGHGKPGEDPTALSFSPVEAFDQTNYDFWLTVIPGYSNINFRINYNSSIFDELQIDYLQQHLIRLIEQVVQKPSITIGELECMDANEKHRITEEFNNTAAEYSSHKTMIGLFEEQVQQRPESIALEFDQTSFTFSELNEQANRLSHYLRSNYAIVPDDRIGIKLERGEWMIISIVAAVKAGGAYVPMDPSYPQERIDYMIADSGCKVVIDERELEKYKEQSNNYSVSNPEQVTGPANLLYVLYTSGSTGRPKGCMIENRSAINHLEWMWQHYGFNHEDIILQKTTFTFDLSVWEIFLPLCYGTKMVLCHREDIGSPERILSLIAINKITIGHFVPSMFTAFLNFFEREYIEDRLKSLRIIMSGGEALPVAAVRSWYSKTDIPLYNLYGPTEATLNVTHYATTRDDTRILIGRPIWNTRMYILGLYNQLIPVGVTGEIYISGHALARGYLNKEELTAEKFVPNPFRPGERMYRTGDVGRWLPGGDIEFMGRKDGQVKIRGFRVEPGEIESALQSYNGLDAVAVVGQSNAHGEIVLVAYVTGKEKLNARELGAYVAQKLPSYMVPSHFIQLDEIPITSSGKTDRKRLPVPDGISTGIEYVAPRNVTEEKLVKIWEGVLRREKIGVKENFFNAGGHSIKAMLLAGQIYREFEVRLELKDLFASVVLEDQARLIEQTRKTKFIPIPLAPEQAGYGLSSSQRRLWVLSQFEEGSLAYNIHIEYLFQGNLDNNALEFSLNALIDRHEILRTVFREDETGEVKQYVLSTRESGFRIKYHQIPEEKEEEIVKVLAGSSSMNHFDLAAGPLIHLLLFKIGENKWIFKCVMHHIISDAWSKGIFINELLQLYTAFLKGMPNPLKPLQIQYKDYAAWEQAQLKEESFQAHKDWWLQQFEGELPVLELPGDNIRPEIKTYNGGVIRKSISSDINKGIKSLSNEQGGTLFMGLLAAVNVLLHRYTSQKDIIVGSIVAGREHADLEGQIGFYLNTLALRTRFSGKDNYRNVLENVKQVTLGAYEHQVYPFEELINELQLPRNMSRHPLIDVMVILQNAKKQNEKEWQKLDDLKVELYAGEEHAVSKFDLLFDFAEIEGLLQLRLEYNSDIYNRDTAERMVQHFEQLLAAIIEQPADPIDSLDFLGAAEKRQLLKLFNDTDREYAREKTVVDIYNEQACRTPGSIAVVFENRTLTYEQLDKRSSQLAHYLQSTGVEKESLVPLCIERSPEMIVAILGIMKAGCAYVPVDLTYPAERIRHVLKDCRANVIVSSNYGKQKIPAVPGLSIIDLDDDWSIISKQPEEMPGTVPAPHQLAYVIYTSGSTGEPKGVMVEHRGMLNHLFSKINDLEIDEKTILAYTASYTFDISVWQMFAALLKGGQTLMYSEKLIYQPKELIRSVSNSKITILELVPSYLAIALEEIDGIILENLRFLLVTGEAVSKSLVTKWFACHDYRHIPVVNAYGPTEASDDICHHLMHGTPAGPVVPVGKPIQNMRIYILNNAWQLCPVGVTGEICVSGIGVSRGYLNHEELTKQKFIENPFRYGKGDKMYKTGDLGRWLPDGTIEYLGRSDEQVKIRGYRIELGEIENVMLECELISQAVVNVTETGADKRLIAYVVPAGLFDKEGILRYLRGKLPEYMMPSVLLELDSLPLTENGKIDRKSLPDPGDTGINTSIEYIAPRNEIEEKMVQIWKEVLGKEWIGVKDNFFEMGGHSLKAIQLISRINIAFMVRVTIQSIFKEATIENISEQVSFLLDQSNQKINKKKLVEIDI
jgi:amino acid adenylation domain-containing protein